MTRYRMICPDHISFEESAMNTTLTIVNFYKGDSHAEIFLNKIQLKEIADFYNALNKTKERM